MRSCYCCIPVIWTKKCTAVMRLSTEGYFTATRTTYNGAFHGLHSAFTSRVLLPDVRTKHTFICCDGCTKIGNGGFPYRCPAHARLPLGRTLQNTSNLYFLRTQKKQRSRDRFKSEFHNCTENSV